MRFRAQKYFFARNAFCAEKLDFSEKAEFHEKGGSGLRKHKFGAVIHTVSWILRFREFPSRKNHRFDGFSRILWKFRAISLFSWNFMNFTRFREKHPSYFATPLMLFSLELIVPLEFNCSGVFFAKSHYFNENGVILVKFH